MAHLRRHLTRIIALALLLPLHALVLPGQVPPAPKTPAFTVFALDESPLWNELRLLPAAKPSVKLTFQGNRRSLPVKVADTTGPLVFGIERVDPATGQTLRIPVVETAWPADATQALVIFISGAEPGTARATMIDDGLAVFPLRSARVFNATTATLLMRIGDHQGELPPGVSPAHPYQVRSETDFTQVGVFTFALGIKDAGGPRRLYETHVDAWPLGRSMLFILPPPPGSGELQIRALVDTPRPPQTAAATRP